MHIIFETPRLTLRRFTEEGAALLFYLNRDPEVIKYVHELPLETEEQALNIIKSIILPQYENDLGRWAIHIKENMEFIGWCGLKFLPKNDEIDLGYRLIKKEWGKGFATEAAQHTLEYGFNKLNLELITGKAHIENTASLNVLEKLGMQFIRKEVEDNCPIKIYTKGRPPLKGGRPC